MQMVPDKQDHAQRVHKAKMIPMSCSMETPSANNVPADVIRSSSFPKRHPLLNYFCLTLLISWSGALAVAFPDLSRGHAVSKLAGILMFPAMLLGPSISGIVLTILVDGKVGLRGLMHRMLRWRVTPKWFALLLLPPVVLLLVLYCLQFTVSAAFSPNHFYIGIFFGIPAGILEEIGWTGYAYPKMLAKWNPLWSAVLLGLLWSLWHLPVINFLGASVPHGHYWLHFFLAFALAMTAMRVLICWLYRSTESVLLAQLMHITSTGALVIFSPPVSPGAEAMWYAIYGCALWLVAGVVIRIVGRDL